MIYGSHRAHAIAHWLSAFWHRGGSSRCAVRVLLVAGATLLLLLTSTTPAEAQRYPVDTNQFVLAPYGPLPDVAVPWKPIYGLNDTNEFWFGTYVEFDWGQLNYSNFWQWADTVMGFKIIEARLDAGTDTAVNPADRLLDAAVGFAGGKWNQRLITTTSPTSLIGFGRDIALFPFDSAQNSFYQCRFLNWRGGTNVQNGTEHDSLRGLMTEVWYDSLNTIAGDTIASRVAFGYQPMQIRPLPNAAYDIDSVENRWVFSQPGDDPNMYLMLRAHLFDSVPSTGNPAGGRGYNVGVGDTLFIVEVVHELPKATHFRTATGVPEVTTSDSSYVFARYPILKGDLQPDDPITRVWSKYREVTLRVNMVQDSSTGTLQSGPWQKDMTSDSSVPIGRFDVRLIWTGKEKAAVRSLSLRDTLVQYALGTTPFSTTIRNLVVDQAERALRGAVWGQPLPLDTLLARTASTRVDRLGKLIRLFTGDEGWIIQTSGFNWVDSVLYRTIGAQPGSPSLNQTKGLRSWRGGNIYNVMMSSHSELTPETYIADPTYLPFFTGIATPNPDTITPPPSWAWVFGEWYPKTPAIEEHNGGRFGIPTLQITESEVQRYTRWFQRSEIGANLNDGYARWPYVGQTADKIAAAARYSRRTGRPMIHWPTSMLPFGIRWLKDAGVPDIIDTVSGTHPVLSGGDTTIVGTDTTITGADTTFVPDTTITTRPRTYEWTYNSQTFRVIRYGMKRDTVSGHIPDATDMRLLINLGLIYGSRGIHYSQTGFADKQYGGPITIIDTTIAAILNGATQDNGPADLGLIGPRLKDTFDVYPNMADPENYAGYVIRGNAFFRMDTIPYLWTGWNQRMHEAQWVNKWWVPHMWPTLQRLRWREGYSIHFTVPQTWGRYATEAQTNVRPIAPGEWIQSVTAEDRYGKVDSTNETFAELTFFDTWPGAGGYDTLWAGLCNRRTFERPKDVLASSARGKTMDSLAEWRKYTVHLRNFTHPDGTAYRYIRLVDIAGDTTRAPWMTGPNVPLDTMIAIGPGGTDSAFTIWLGPGRAAILRATFINPDPVNISGSLAYNNQKHVMWDGRRWHATFAQLDGSDSASFGGSNIVYAWSKHTDSGNTTLRWDTTFILNVPYDSTIVPCADSSFRSGNRHPSISAFRSGDTTRVTVVWTCHLAVPLPGQREIVARSLLLIDDTTQPRGVRLVMGKLRHVESYYGYYTAPWGIPIVSMWDGGELFTWSDSIGGIVSKLRLNAGQWGTCAPDIWSNTLYVSNGLGFYPMTIPASDFISPPQYVNSMFPTMAPLAQIRDRDSSNGLAWQQPDGTGKNDIVYTRIQHSDTGVVPVPVITANNLFVVNDQLGAGDFYHPSMDLWQWPWGQCMEGITWEEKGNKFVFAPKLWYRSINTTVSFPPGGDIMNPPIGWGYQSYLLPPFPDTMLGGVPLSDNVPHWWLWPNIGALNESWDEETNLDDAHMAIAYEDSAQSFNPTEWGRHRLWETQIYFGFSTIKPGFPKLYSYDGRHPAVSSSQRRQSERAVTLYEVGQGLAGPTPIYSTRQFFAREARPQGYLATGRDLVMLDTAKTGVVAGLLDVWVSDNDSARAIGMTLRDSTMRFVDTFSTAERLVKTASFQTHDSTVIGLRALARFTGDSAHGSQRGIGVTLRWELIDELTSSVVAVLDSATVDAEYPYYDHTLAATFDLVSGSYHVRMRADTLGITPRPLTAAGSRWPVVETSMLVAENLFAAKAVRKGEAEGSRARLSVQPNPASDRTEVMVSVPEESTVRVSLYTVAGQAVGIVYEGQLERGRYSLPCSLGNLPSGSYLVELVAGRTRLTQRLIVR